MRRVSKFRDISCFLYLDSDSDPRRTKGPFDPKKKESYVADLLLNKPVLTAQ